MAIRQIYNLQDLCKKITKGTTPNTKVGGFTSSGINFIKSESLSYDGLVDPSKFAFISSDTHQKLKRSMIEENDILYSIAGMNLGKCASINKNNLPANTNQAVAIIRVDEQKAYSKYIEFFLRNRSFVRSILGGVAQSAQPNVNLAEIGKFQITLPSFSEQKAIASVLGALDNKIKNNHQMNETLEEMERVIFKSWFVDFDPVHAKAAGNAPAHMDTETAKLFPSSFADNGLPVGWNRVSADTICSITIGRTPPRKEQQWFSSSNDDIKWASIKDMGECGTYIFQTSEKLTVEATNKFNVCIVPKNTVILSFKLTVGRVAITDEAIATNEAIAHFNKLDSKYGFIQTEYLYTYLKGFNFDQLGSTSSIATAVNSKTIKAMPIMIAEPSCRDAFHKLVFPMFEQIRSNQKENQTLVELRDLLLPKLISGEICVKDAEREMEAAV